MSHLLLGKPVRTPMTVLCDREGKCAEGLQKLGWLFRECLPKTTAFEPGFEG